MWLKDAVHRNHTTKDTFPVHIITCVRGPSRHNKKEKKIIKIAALTISVLHNHKGLAANSGTVQQGGNQAGWHSWSELELTGKKR